MLPHLGPKSTWKLEASYTVPYTSAITRRRPQFYQAPSANLQNTSAHGHRESYGLPQLIAICVSAQPTPAQPATSPPKPTLGHHVHHKSSSAATPKSTAQPQRRKPVRFAATMRSYKSVKPASRVGWRRIMKRLGGGRRWRRRGRRR